MRLAELAITLMPLYEKATDPNDVFYNSSYAQTFLSACAASAKLGLDKRAQKDMPSGYDRKKSERNLKRADKFVTDKGLPDVEFTDAISLIQNAIVLAWKLRDRDEGGLPESLPNADILSFQKLRALLGVEPKYETNLQLKSTSLIPTAKKL